LKYSITIGSRIGNPDFLSFIVMIRVTSNHDLHFGVPQWPLPRILEETRFFVDPGNVSRSEGEPIPITIGLAGNTVL